MEDLVVDGLTIPAFELDESFETSGGPGGQHANRSATAVRLQFRIVDSSLPEEVKVRLRAKLGEVVEVVASEERSQLRNRERARRRMQGRIREALREPKPRRQTRPTKASKNRRLKAKKIRSETKRRRRSPTIDPD
jgi:ribosome-associated protein